MTAETGVRTETTLLVPVAVRVMDHGGIELLIDPLDLDGVVDAFAPSMLDHVTVAVDRDDVHLALWPRPDLGGS